jgi:hypothetical protein
MQVADWQSKQKQLGGEHRASSQSAICILQSAMATAVLGLLLVVCAGGGCAKPTYDKYIPSEDRAKQALETALNAWRDGKMPGAIEGGPMPVQAVDSTWRSGKQLQAYEILGEEAGQGPRVFSVRLTLKGRAAAPTTVRYYVVGKEPLWVYREDDYKAPAGM